MESDFQLPPDLLDRIDAYYEGDLSAEEAAALRARLRADAELAAAAARYEAVYRHGFRSSPDELNSRDAMRDTLHQLEASLEPVTLGRERRLWPRILGVAATVLLLLAVGWWLLARPDPDTRLAQDSIEWLPREGALLGPREDAEEGLDAYDQKEYERAYPLLRAGVASGTLDSINLLYAGVSALAIGQAEEAQQLLTEVLDTGRYPYDEGDLRFYLALAELQLQNREAALRQLQLARDLEGYTTDDARQLLNQLEGEE
ncbi:hypothetical protein CLV84_1126 [Neolewinella xylanilytica]|uniref:Tetratricopeptide repeat protein n=1 Tax=Neolewinella xylanilytica TaxID=1514080 RepID=A0A2S6I9J1_9BACT|nr:hypothetical protein [Neolewinella xylanilytica]PPK88161.1 hypothetical protein CLV84_1126 [Neolewinella xylanilytica]